jgi:hypothetical protein
MAGTGFEDLHGETGLGTANTRYEDVHLDSSVPFSAHNGVVTGARSLRSGAFKGWRVSPLNLKAYA